jgi:hypothetical protein
MKRILKIIVMLSVGVYLNYRLIAQADHYSIFDAEINVALGAIALGIFAWVLLTDNKEYRKIKSWAAFIPTVTGLFTAVTLVVTHLLLLQRDKSPSKLYCVSRIVDFNGVFIDFREDGTYKLTSWCLGADIYRGVYTRKDSIITLDKNNIDNVIESNKLLIRQDGETDSLGNRERSIYQIDKNGQVIKTGNDFRVIDNTKP